MITEPRTCHQAIFGSLEASKWSRVAQGGLHLLIREEGRVVSFITAYGSKKLERRGRHGDVHRFRPGPRRVWRVAIAYTSGWPAHSQLLGCRFASMSASSQHFKDWRKRGFMSLLYGKALEIAEHRGLRYVTLNTYPERPLGFEWPMALEVPGDVRAGAALGHAAGWGAGGEGAAGEGPERPSREMGAICVALQPAPRPWRFAPPRPRPLGAAPLGAPLGHGLGLEAVECTDAAP